MGVLFRFGQRDTSFLMTSLIEDPADHQDGAPRAETRSAESHELKKQKQVICKKIEQRVQMKTKQWTVTRQWLLLCSVLLIQFLNCFSLFSDFICSSGRHADAIFTNSYRKVLGQISARKILQTIMGKRLGWVTLQLHRVPVKRNTEN